MLFEYQPKGEHNVVFFIGLCHSLMQKFENEIDSSCSLPVYVIV
jgi:hypothetical protein